MAMTLCGHLGVGSLHALGAPTLQETLIGKDPTLIALISTKINGSNLSLQTLQIPWILMETKYNQISLGPTQYEVLIFLPKPSTYLYFSTDRMSLSTSSFILMQEQGLL